MQKRISVLIILLTILLSSCGEKTRYEAVSERENSRFLIDVDNGIYTDKHTGMDYLLDKDVWEEYTKPYVYYLFDDTFYYVDLNCDYLRVVCTNLNKGTTFTAYTEPGIQRGIPYLDELASRETSAYEIDRDLYYRASDMTLFEDKLAYISGCDLYIVDLNKGRRRKIATDCFSIVEYNEQGIKYISVDYEVREITG